MTYAPRPRPKPNQNDYVSRSNIQGQNDMAYIWLSHLKIVLFTLDDIVATQNCSFQFDPNSVKSMVLSLFNGDCNRKRIIVAMRLQKFLLSIFCDGIVQPYYRCLRDIKTLFELYVFVMKPEVNEL